MIAPSQLLTYVKARPFRPFRGCRLHGRLRAGPGGPPGRAADRAARSHLSARLFLGIAATGLLIEPLRALCRLGRAPCSAAVHKRGDGDDGASDTVLTGDGHPRVDRCMSARSRSEEGRARRGVCRLSACNARVAGLCRFRVQRRSGVFLANTAFASKGAKPFRSRMPIRRSDTRGL